MGPTYQLFETQNVVRKREISCLFELAEKNRSHNECVNVDRAGCFKNFQLESLLF